MKDYKYFIVRSEKLIYEKKDFIKLFSQIILSKNHRENECNISKVCESKPQYLCNQTIRVKCVRTREKIE